MNTDQPEKETIGDPQPTFTQLERKAARNILERMSSEWGDSVKVYADAYLALNKAALLSKLNGLLSPENFAPVMKYIEVRLAEEEAKKAAPKSTL